MLLASLLQVSGFLSLPLLKGSDILCCWFLPCGSAGIVIYIVDSSLRISPTFPADCVCSIHVHKHQVPLAPTIHYMYNMLHFLPSRKWFRSIPGGSTIMVIHIICSALWIKSLLPAVHSKDGIYYHYIFVHTYTYAHNITVTV